MSDLIKKCVFSMLLDAPPNDIDDFDLHNKSHDHDFHHFEENIKMSIVTIFYLLYFILVKF